MAQTARKTRKGPGKFYREGISMLDLAEMFPDEAAATKWFERIMWGEYRPCPHCGQPQHAGVQEPQADAIPLPRLPGALLCSDPHCPGAVPYPPEKVGLGHLSMDHQPEGCSRHEAPPRPEDQLQVGLVHGSPAPGVLHR